MLVLLSVSLIIQSLHSSEINSTYRCLKLLDENSVMQREQNRWISSFAESLSKQPPNLSEIYHLITMGVTYNYIFKYNMQQMEPMIIKAINLIAKDPILLKKMYQYKIPWLKLMTYSGSVNIQNILAPIAETSKSRIPSHLRPRESQLSIINKLKEQLLSVQQSLKCNNQSGEFDHMVTNAVAQCKHFLRGILTKKMTSLEYQSVVQVFGLIVDIQGVYESICNERFTKTLTVMVDYMVRITAIDLNSAIKTYEIISKTFPEFKDSFKAHRNDLISNGSQIQMVRAEWLIIQLNAIKCNPDNHKPEFMQNLFGLIEEALKEADNRQISVFEFDVHFDLYQAALETSKSFDVIDKEEYILRITKHTLNLINYSIHPGDISMIYISLVDTYPQYIEHYTRMVQDLQRGFVSL